MMIACECSDPEIVRILLDKGSAVLPLNSPTIPLFIACQRGNLEIVRLLIIRHSEIMKYHEHKEKAIEISILHNHHHVVDFLKSFDPSPHINRFSSSSSSSLVQTMNDSESMENSETESDDDQNDSLSIEID